ncbi:hypothetical protein L1F30_01020 [Simiduia sp. 21SJ11W-1]|uniref:lipopolysaccharide kinase InaA family protein n=1 Tax=Simiduia sp. 21SJ11W-1 TaxID=2909669 RepID=UPI00209CD040|nr:lipopolysaccharide kinase InaA family protein [Simiduia sp. 21SJ11W-1]UTA48137.1 hypothetical protein L1F30_01020 [Simiduia sp. 21SJ11W-1]
MFHCDASLETLLKKHHLHDAARLWDWCAQKINFAPGQGLSDKKTADINFDGDSASYRVYISQNQLERKGWLWQTRPKLRELYQNHLLCEARGIATTEAVCYGEQRLPDTQCWRALMLVRTPTDFKSAHEFVKQWPSLALAERQPVLDTWATHIAAMHNQRLAHHNLHSVNVLMNAQREVRIDHLERLGYQWRTVVASVNDLACFMRGMAAFDTADTEYFLQQYWRHCKLGLTYQGLRQRVLAQAASTATQAQ